MLANFFLNAENFIGTITVPDESTAMNVTENMDNVLQALGIMGKGMLGIFVVIGLIAVIVALLTKAGNNK